MAKATIKAKSGSVITIEGSDEEISNIVTMVERASTVTHAREAGTKTRIKRSEQKKRVAASDLIAELKEGGFFNKPKTLGEITKALEEKGYVYPMTTLSGVMIGLVQRKLLGRKRTEGKWVYGR